MPEAARSAAGVAEIPPTSCSSRTPGDPRPAAGRDARLRSGRASRRVPTRWKPRRGGGEDLLELAPSSLQSLEVVPGAALLAWPPGGRGPSRRAVRGPPGVGAGGVVALAWGPEAEPDPGRRGPPVGVGARGRPRHRGAAEVDGTPGPPRPEGDGSGRLVRRAPDGEGGSAGVRARCLPGGPAGPEQGRRSPRRPRGREGAFRFPAGPAPEHRGAGVDEDRLRALASAGQGLRLPPGRPPPDAPPGLASGTLAPGRGARSPGPRGRRVSGGPGPGPDPARRIRHERRGAPEVPGRGGPAAGAALLPAAALLLTAILGCRGAEGGDWGPTR